MKESEDDLYSIYTFEYLIDLQNLMNNLMDLIKIRKQQQQQTMKIKK